MVVNKSLAQALSQLRLLQFKQNIFSARRLGWLSVLALLCLATPLVWRQSQAAGVDANALALLPPFVQEVRFLEVGGATGEQFGHAVALSGNTAVVGVPYDLVGSNGLQGSVYVYVKSGAIWVQQQKITASD